MRLLISINDTSNMHSSTFANGIMQNAMHLYNLLCKEHEVYFLVRKESWNIENYNLKTYNEIFKSCEKFDAALQVGMTIAADEREMLHKKNGTIIVLVKYGNELMIDIEAILHPDPGNHGYLNVKSQNDLVMMSPHHMYYKEFMEQMLKTSVVECPYIWEPTLLNNLEPFTQDDQLDVPDIIVMEPNGSVLKNCITPLAIADRLYTKNPLHFGKFHVYNGIHIAKHSYYKNNILPYFEVLHSHNEKCIFHDRQIFKNVFTKPHVLICHQDNCDLNYLYNEAMYMNIPFVHNSKRLHEWNIGYYYNDYNVESGYLALLTAINSFKRDFHKRAKENAEYLKSLSINNELNLKTYVSHIQDGIECAKIPRLVKQNMQRYADHKTYDKCVVCLNCKIELADVTCINYEGSQFQFYMSYAEWDVPWIIADELRVYDIVVYIHPNLCKNVEEILNKDFETMEFQYGSNSISYIKMKQCDTCFKVLNAWKESKKEFNYEGGASSFLTNL